MELQAIRVAYVVRYFLILLKGPSLYPRDLTDIILLYTGCYYSICCQDVYRGTYLFDTVLVHHISVTGQLPLGQLPLGQLPWGQLPWGQLPHRTITPIGQLTRGQLPPRTITPIGQLPQGQLPPRIITPVGQLPWGQLPLLVGQLPPKTFTPHNPY